MFPPPTVEQRPAIVPSASPPRTKPGRSRRLPWAAALLGLAFGSALSAATEPTEVQLRVVWEQAPPDGAVEVRHGTLVGLQPIGEVGRAAGNRYSFSGEAEPALLIRLHDARLDRGAGATLVTVGAADAAFTFFARDVTAAFPIFLPRIGVAVTTAEDTRTYAAIAADLVERGGSTRAQEAEAAPEARFAEAAQRTRDQPAPTWLGLSRENRLFIVHPALARSGLEQDVIQFTRGARPVTLPDRDDREVAYGVGQGRGQGPVVGVTRWLEDGVLPLLHEERRDGEVRYHTITLVSLTRSPLRRDTVRGTPYLVADLDASGHALTEDQRRQAEAQRAAHPPAEPPVLYRRTTATNTGAVPRYAWLKAPKPGWSWADRVPYNYDATTGFSHYAPDRVFSIAQLDGHPLPQEEVAVLLQPGESIRLDCRLPHEPVDRATAGAIATQDFTARHREARAYWRTKLDATARFQVPERRVNEMLQAGFLHLDLVTYGLEPDGVLAPTIGIYPPIGTESAPIVLFYASLGLREQARRCVDYFLAKQRPDGSILNFADYVIETGAVLWLIGEYHRYFPDAAWAKRVVPSVRRAASHLLDWRERNRRPDLRQRGYGMIDGKVADPNDPYHQFMLNAYGYAGLHRASELLRSIAHPDADRFAHAAAEWRADLRASLGHAMARSPVVPLADGRWSRTAPPWPETVGPRSLYATGEKQFTHGAFTVADSLLGPLHLVFTGVLEPEEPLAAELLEGHQELWLSHHVAFSQPYYSRHPWILLHRGEVKPFLQGWYHAFSALADRETYTFWEHLHQVSAHKVHEEAWFLLETRWMLYLEDGDTLNLLAGVPRAWLESGNTIAVERGQSQFGPVSFRVEATDAARRITAEIRCPGDRRPGRIVLRVPHPEGIHPQEVIGGHYDRDRETLLIAPFDGDARVELRY